MICFLSFITFILQYFGKSFHVLNSFVIALTLWSILAFPGGMQSPFLKLGSSPATIPITSKGNRASIFFETRWIVWKSHVHTCKSKSRSEYRRKATRCESCNNLSFNGLDDLAAAAVSGDNDFQRWFCKVKPVCDKGRRMSLHWSRPTDSVVQREYCWKTTHCTLFPFFPIIILSNFSDTFIVDVL